MTNQNQPNNDKRTRVTIREEGLSRDEQSVLCAVRLICMNYSNPACFTWESALETCERDFGAERGPQIGMVVMKCMRALRMTRTSGFNFTNLACPCCREKLSDHELAFMRLLTAQRTGNGLSRQTHALILCEGADASRLLGHMEQLAILLAQHTEVIRQVPVRPPKLKFRFSS
ncbi:hypothetical protein FIV06_29100 (plasmid) [Labrenzia sp. THAF191b]|nr:hypothetical protein FIV06_29100 [Labrenzia sp. THAF191b]QFT08230.1 hypothetical protein FIV05_31065 [Labrenzia sp. THAF191a]QFT19406.1 hypothetical protein FIV03_29235 [Labrenzia sp. THAF187b]